MDVAILATLLLAFGVLVATHVTVSLKLLFRSPWWRGLIALLVPPLAPYWAYESGIQVGAAIWLASLFAYLLALIAALSI